MSADTATALSVVEPWAGGRGMLAGQVADALAAHRSARVVPLIRALGYRDELTAADELVASDNQDTAGVAPADAALADAVSADLTLADVAGVDGSLADAEIHMYGHQAIVGPFSASGGARQPCARCLTRRWQAVRSPTLRDALELGSGTRAVGESPYATPFAADALAALLAAAHGASDGDGAAGAGTVRSTRASAYVYVLDLETLGVERRALIADPECPACGRRVPDRADAAEIELAPTPKRAPGNFRPRDAAQYEIDHDALANPVCGALGARSDPDLASRSTSATVGSFNLRAGSYLRESFWGGHANTYAESTRVGLLEGFERTAGMRPRGKQTAVFASWDALDAPAVDPRECGLYSDEFYRSQPWVNPFRTDRPIPWVWGYSLRDRRAVLVPEILAYYHAPGGLENRFVQESSNGCASGGSLAEAVYHGLMEVVERDAFLIAWYGGVPLPEIDAAHSGRAATRAMVDRLAMYGYRARFFDARISFPIPVVIAAAQRIDGGTGALCFGAGASLDPEAALNAGLCEIATDAVNLPWRTRLAEPRLRAMAADFGKVEILHDHPLLYGLPQMARHAAFLLGERPAPPGEASLTPALLAVQTARAGLAPSDDLAEDVERCVAVLAEAGFDVVVVDQTSPDQRDLGLHTVSVLVPGLLPIDFGWSRQRALRMPRLHKALRALARSDSDPPAETLNQAPHPFP